MGELTADIITMLENGDTEFERHAATVVAGLADDNRRLRARAREMGEVLEAVLAYHHGEPPYDFHKLPAYDRENEAFDAWQRIRDERLKPALAAYRTETNDG